VQLIVKDLHPGGSEFKHRHKVTYSCWCYDYHMVLLLGCAPF